MTGSDSVERREVFFTGQVQGVGFRYTALRLAQDFAVGGWVRNLSDGRVELVAEGTPGELDRFLARLHLEMARYIRQTDLCSRTATGEFEGRGLTIRH